MTVMQAIEGARVIPGAHVDEPPAEDSRNASDGKLVRGRALIFWDPKIPGKKLDAIDTDQITPEDDCVSESLERLEKRWKLGAFRYLLTGYLKSVQRDEACDFSEEI